MAFSISPLPPSLLRLQSINQPPIVITQKTYMATVPTFFLQEPSLTWKPPFSPSLHYPTIKHFQSSFPHLRNPRLTLIKCCYTNTNNTNNKNVLIETKIKESPVQIMAKTLKKALKALRKPAAAALLVGLLLLYDPNLALAASGGRMGGNSFSSRSSSPPSSSYSVPSMSAGGGSGFSYSVPYYAPSPSSSYSVPMMSAGGGSGFSYSVPYHAPSPSSSYSVPMMSAGGGSGFSYSVPYYADPAVGIGSGGSVLTATDKTILLLLVAFAAFVLVSVFLSEGSGGSVLTATEKTSVLKLQVGLLGLGKSLQKDLNWIAETADTSTSEGLHYVLTETILALLRHPDYRISAYSSVDVKSSMDEGEKRFNELSIEERGKFDEETLVNVNNIKKQRSTTGKGSGFSNEYIVLTILVAAGGLHKLPSMNNSKDLKEALQKLASIPSSRTLAVEVLWTPQNEDDTLSEREFLEDYPLLCPL